MANNEKQIAMRVSVVSVAVNMLLSVLKLAAGIIAHSGAMVSDAVHSASDVFSTFVVMIGVHMASKEADEEHPYGHERMECVAAIVLSAVLFATGLAIGYNGLDQLLGGGYKDIKMPGKGIKAFGGGDSSWYRGDDREYEIPQKDM